MFKATGGVSEGSNVNTVASVISWAEKVRFTSPSGLRSTTGAETQV